MILGNFLGGAIVKYLFVFALFLSVISILDYLLVSVDPDKLIEATRRELLSRNISDKNLKFKITRVERRLWMVKIERVSSEEKLYYSNSNRVPVIMTFDTMYRLVDFD